MQLRAHVFFDPATGGLGLTIYLQGDGLKVARLSHDGLLEFHPVDEGIYSPPTIRFPAGIAEEVVEAFVRHAASASGYVPTEARKDYLAERERVDRLIDAVANIATQATTGTAFNPTQES